MIWNRIYVLISYTWRIKDLQGSIINFYIISQKFWIRTLLKVKPCLEGTTHSSMLPKNLNSNLKKLASEEISSVTPELLLEWLIIFLNFLDLSMLNKKVQFWFKKKILFFSKLDFCFCFVFWFQIKSYLILFSFC